MTDDQKTTIKGYVSTINTGIVSGDNDLLDFVLDEVVDRVLLYLNETALDTRLERIIARVVVSVYNQTNNNKEGSGVENSITSISDNGQSITYSKEVKNYLATADDGALFGGFSALLAPYRRVNVAS